MEPLQAYLTGKALQAFGHVDESFDRLSEKATEEISSEIRNVCAKLHVTQDDKINEVCAILNMKKRRFIELALLQAVDQANAVIRELHQDHTHD